VIGTYMSIQRRATETLTSRKEGHHEQSQRNSVAVTVNVSIEAVSHRTLLPERRPEMTKTSAILWL